MAFVDQYVAEFVGLEVRLLNARERLRASTDDEALHALRIAVRRIRSLLIPVRRLEGVERLKLAAAEVGRLTTPTRDLEVMAKELDARGQHEAAQTRRSRLAEQYQVIARSPVLNELFTALDRWPSTFRASSAGHDDKALRGVVTKSLSRLLDKLHLAVDDKHHDRHELRILVKRARYLTEAFQHLSPLSPRAARSLKKVQGALGSWHDHHQWCLRVQDEPDLRPLESLWAESSDKELAQAEVELKKLKKLLPPISKKARARAPAPAPEVAETGETDAEGKQTSRLP